jgi:HlyD family secretion protein
MQQWWNSSRGGWRSGRIRWTAVLSLATGLLAALVALAPVVGSRLEERRILTATVRRASFDSMVVASGQAASSNSTEIQCKLQRITSGTTPTIISLVPDGTTVTEGDVLCEIDASAYNELVRTQEIRVQEARATYLQAVLDLEVSEIGARAYVEGQMIETDRLYRGQIALSRSDLNRQGDRTEWTRRMLAKGYASTVQVATEEQSMLRMKLTLAQCETAFRNFARFSAPITIRALQGQVIGAKANLGFQTIRLNREQERLALYKTQVEACTVRAPHDGFVIYARPQGRDPGVDLGVPVRQRQKLFTLPDLSRMEIQALLHETVVSRVSPGMPVRVRLEALPGRTYEGVVTSVSPLPLAERKEETSTDVTYFLARISLATLPKGLRPGMSAELEIVTNERRGVLAVPYTAVEWVGDRHVCRVVHKDKGPDRVERRPVTVGASSHDLVEVTGGLAEGETVLLDAKPATAAL